MPIYLYHCSDCKEEFEEIVFSGKEPKACEKCGSENIKRIISSSSFVLKGDCWGKDGYFVPEHKIKGDV
jgi:putative FmdB family regulatory protein